MHYVKTVLTAASLFVSHCLMAQTKDADITGARALAKHYYSKGDFLNAYKFLLIYKYSHWDSLNSATCKQELQAVNNAISYSEKNIKDELSVNHSEILTLKAKGFREQADIDSINALKIKNAPKLN